MDRNITKSPEGKVSRWRKKYIYFFLLKKASVPDSDPDAATPVKGRPKFYLVPTEIYFVDHSEKLRRKGGTQGLMEEVNDESLVTGGWAATFASMWSSVLKPWASREPCYSSENGLTTTE